MRIYLIPKNVESLFSERSTSYILDGLPPNKQLLFFHLASIPSTQRAEVGIFSSV